MCGYSFAAEPLRQGAMTALLASLFVACGAMLLLGLLLERRLLRPRDMPLACTIGDPILAVSICLGVQIMGTRRPCGVIGPTGQFAAAGLWLLFGLWQWRTEVRAGFYTRRQALSPTKIWHQLVIYPTVGTWAAVAIVGGLMNAWRTPFSALLMILGLAIWAVTVLHNFRHPRLGHPPYDWGRLRPVPPPWGEDSATLRSAAQSKLVFAWGISPWHLRDAPRYWHYPMSGTPRGGANVKES